MQLYNSLTKQKHAFKPIEKNKIKMYVCGMTVYDYCHIGHARSWVVFDVAIRYWRSRGYEVIYVHNITDIDDKIIKRANENQESCDALTERFITAMHEDERALNLLRPTHEPRATQFVPQIIALIEKIIAQGCAYVADNGDVYFNVREFKDYGKLSHRSIDDLISGARVDVNEQKNDPLDFVLWKSAKPGEPQWDSPWGKGRPGWHIECSAMAENLLGQSFDIHGGGMDLKFPHHENEIAQSEAAHRCHFVNTWMHVGLLNVDDEKMSKSLNNFITIREALKQYHPEILRYFMLSGYYRSPINYSEKNMLQIQQSLAALYTAIRGLPLNDVLKKSEFTQKFNEAMDDDLNSPEAFAVLFEMAREINRLRNKNKTEAAIVLANELKQLATIFGFLQDDPDVFLQGKMNHVEKIEALIVERNQARAEKNWARADAIRDELIAMGIILEDANGETIWRKA